MKTIPVCPGCAAMLHHQHEAVYPTGFMVPDTDPYRDRNRMIVEHRECECPRCTADGHMVSVVSPLGIVQAMCLTCGWKGPDRTGDEHAAGLVVDDRDWHVEEVSNG